MLAALGGAWRGWIKFATILGNIQMTVLLSLVYWTMVALTAFPMKLFSDPLALNRKRAGWVKRMPITDAMSSMKKQG